MKLKANKDKKLVVTIDSIVYYRYPIKTHIVSSKDEINKTVKKYVEKYLKKGDIVVVSERIIAIMQGRSYLIKDIKPGLWAKKLYPFVSKHPGGIGLRSPYTMQLAIQEAGLARILIAAFCSIVTKPLELKGIFYRVVGRDINAIDGPCDYTLPPGNKSAKLGPKNPKRVAQELEKEIGVGVIIMDANDYGVCILGASDLADAVDLPIYKIFSDNPMGQARQQTPIVILRKG